MMSYLFAPYENADGDIDFSESGVRHNSNNSEKELVEMDAPGQSPSSPEDHKQMHSIEMSDSDWIYVYN